MCTLHNFFSFLKARKCVYRYSNREYNEKKVLVAWEYGQFCITIYLEYQFLCGSACIKDLLLWNL